MAQADTVTRRDLLFAAFAVQEGLVDRSTLAEALPGWSSDPSSTLVTRLLALGNLDPAEVGRVEALVDLHAPASTIAATPTPEPDRGAGRTEAFTPGPADPDPTTAHDPDATEPATPSQPSPGADRNGHGPRADGRGSSGRFRILKAHAQGGLGAVSVAMDAELNRKVAFKQILRQHADDPSSRARFLLEAEITGGLEHPGIVPVYALGSDAAGRPYYAMRFIHGGNLKQAIAEFHGDPALKADPGARSLALRELLRRFVDVCNAVDYAHGRGVLHRDLKPSNIIAGEHGETLVVDWGLAKATGRHDPGIPDDDRVLIPSISGDQAQTMPGSALGTVAFMSPEAAQGDLEHLGPRSDVYSLGATLYCILTGHFAFDGAPMLVLLGQVKAGEFPRPREVDPAVDPALEAICLKAMALEPDGRYPSARDLAGDLLRWSADEPVGAYPEGRRRRASRWVRRHASTVAGIGALLIGTSATLALAAGLISQARDRADQARGLLATSNANLAREGQESERARAEAVAGYKLAREAVRGLLADVAQYELPNIPRAEKLRLGLIHQAVGYYRRFNDRRSVDPEIRDELVQVEEQAAGLHRATGHYEEAREHYEEALTLLRREVEGGPARPRVRENLAYIEGEFGELLRYSGGRVDEAEAHDRRGFDLASDLAKDFPGNLRYRFLEGRAAANLAYILIAAGRPEEALPFAVKADERARAFEATLRPDKLGNDPAFVGSAIGPYPMALARLGRPEAEPAARALVETLGRFASAQPESGDLQYLLAESRDELARVIAGDRPDEALGLEDRAVDGMAPVVDEHPAIVAFPPILARFRAHRAVVRAALGQLDPARADLEQALATFRAEVARVNGPLTLEDLARATADLARLEAKRGRAADARRLFLEAIAGHDEALKIDPGALINIPLRQQARAELDALGPP